MPPAPRRVRWTDHALEKAALLGIARTAWNMPRSSNIADADATHDQPTGCSPPADS
jgi:hypothetical protein